MRDDAYVEQVWLGKAMGPGQRGGACGGDGSVGTLLVTAWLEEMGDDCAACVAFSRKHCGRRPACMWWGEEKEVTVPCPKERRSEKRAGTDLLLSSPCSASDPLWWGFTPLQVRMNEIGVLLERNHSKFNFSCKDQIMRCVKHRTTWPFGMNLKS